ncbi:hypothetical protein TWF696_005583 [Orbilia brochopaga]|uniref:Uncharacterized protein n=1 Tax=Orbilia brochopaga TaxID=3140254 RepID=A0AAV9V3I1_9PEZI
MTSYGVAKSFGISFLLNCFLRFSLIIQVAVAQSPGGDGTGLIDPDEVDETEIIEGGQAELPVSFGPQYLAQNQAAIREWAGWESSLARQELRAQQAAKNLGEVNGYWGPESDLVVVTAQAWQGFEHALALDSANIQGSPFYLLEGVRRFTELCDATLRSIRTIKQAIKRMKLTDDVDLWEKYEAIFIISTIPMTNRALHNPEEYKRLSRLLAIPRGKTLEQYPKWLQTMITFATSQLEQFTELDLPGIADEGSSLGPLEGPMVVPTKEMQRRSVETMFDYNRGENDDADDVYLADGDFVLVWKNIHQVINAVTYFEAFCMIDVDRTWDLYVFKYGTVRDLPLSLSPPVIGKYKRQQIGYRKYFEYKYESRTVAMAPDDPEWKTWETTKDKAYFADMLEGFMQHLTNAARHVLPLMMEMMADIAVEAHQLAEDSILPIDSQDLEHFAILTGEDYEAGRLPLELSTLDWDLLEQHPEFNATRYVSDTRNSGPEA